MYLEYVIRGTKGTRCETNLRRRVGQVGKKRIDRALIVEDGRSRYMLSRVKVVN